MHFLVRAFIDLMVTMFFVGLAGSAIVILISFAEDFRELFGSDESSPEIAAAPQTAPPGAGSSSSGAK